MIRVKKLCVYGVAALSLGVPVQAAFAQCGTASWYHEGSRTANGERYRPDGISAAHRTLPFGTRVQVHNQRTGRSIVVRINDRGPFIKGRIIDLSRGAQRALGMGGLAPVCLAVLGRGPSVVASAEDGEERARPRRIVRHRVASASTRKSTVRHARLTRAEKRRYAKLDRRQRIAARYRQNWTSASEVSRAELRALSRKARRAEQREQRRLKRQAAAELRMSKSGS
jgi:rare lipoprotein A